MYRNIVDNMEYNSGNKKLVDGSGAVSWRGEICFWVGVVGGEGGHDVGEGVPDVGLYIKLRLQYRDHRARPQPLALLLDGGALCRGWAWF